MSNICELSAVTLRRLIGAGEVSPVELLAACRERIEQANPRLNAFVTFCWDRAEAEARAAEKQVRDGDALGPLHGLPIGIKDTMVSGGVLSTFGSPIYADNIPDADERLVAETRRAGAIVVGKTNAPEFGAGANTTNAVFGPTRNPFDTDRICGGSSGGSAVALSCDMVPLATGSDTGGSLRTPAGYCGVVGLRPSPGLVPMSRRGIGYTAISVQGPMGRDVADTALLLSTIAGADPVDPLAGPVDPADLTSLPEVDLSTLRVAVSEDLGFAPVDTSIRETFRAVIGDIRGSFATVEESTPPLKGSNEIFEVLRSMAFLVNHEAHYRDHRDKLGPNLIANMEQAASYSFADAAHAQAEQTRLYRAFVDYMDDYDILLAPTAAVPPFPVEQLYPTHINGEELRSYFHWLGLAYGLTLTSHPVITIPCGLDATGTPFGLQICGRRWGDRRLLAIAAAVESHLKSLPARARPYPDIAALSHPD